ncbi:MAG: peptidylprolyl isomerase [Bacteroidales bacterium]|nr:peptidylprolyl isomerase [Bacteroidales bacterium]
MRKQSIIVVLFILQVGCMAQGAKNVIDEIIATVGSRIITRSDLEYAVQGFKYSSGLATLEADEETQLRCDIIEQLIFQKLLIHQAELDSILITDAQVNERLDYNLKEQIVQIGGDVKKLEQYYGKSLAEIKADSREQMRDEYLTEEMQKKLTADLNIINQEVKDYFKSIPQDSVPVIPVEYELAQIVKTPVISEAEKISIKQNLENMRDRVLRGENFSTFARMYSEDPGSAMKGGEIGFTGRGELFPEFETAAYALKPGEMSSVVETEAGYHIIRMLDRRGDRINVAHILIKPKPSPEAMQAAKSFLDSVYTLLQTRQLSFDSAALLFSDMPDKTSGGKIVNPYTAAYGFQEAQLVQYDKSKSLLYLVEDMNAGDYTRTIPMITESGNQAYRIVCLKTKRPEHRANLTDDYEKIRNAAFESKKQKTLIQWAKNKIKYTHLKINPDFRSCSFVEEWEIEF